MLNAFLKYTFLGLFVLMALFAVQQSNAYAQEDGVYNPDKEFSADEWGKPPNHFGSFVLFSEVEILQRYIDNVYAQKNNEQGDFATIVKPKAQLVRPFGRHKASLSFSGEGRKYYELTDEDQINYALKAGLDLEGYHNLHFPIALTHALSHVNRSDSSRFNIITREPVKVIENTFSAGVMYEPNRLKLEFLGTYAQRRVPDGDSVLPAPGVTVIGKDRDKNSLKFEAEASYEMMANWRPILRLEHIRDSYDQRLLTTTGFTGPVQDSQKTRVLAGFGFDFKDLVGLRALFGQEYRKYDDPTVKSISGSTAEAALLLSPSEKTDLKFKFLRTNNDDNILLSGVRQNIYEADLEHEFTSRLSGELGVDYRQTDYLNLNRNDDDLRLEASLIYKIQRGLFLDGGYTFNSRDSSDNNAAYDQNIFRIGIRKQF